MDAKHRRFFNALVRKAGSLTRLASDLGVPLSTVNNWRDRPVPSEWAARIERLYGIPVYHTRPHDWRLWWPDAKSLMPKRATQ